MPVPGLLRAAAAARRLAEVAAVLGLTGSDGPGVAGGSAVQPDVLVTGLCLDSRSVRPGDLYAALPGRRTHGARFAAAAAAAGAAAVLTDPAGVPLAAGAGLPVLAVPDPRGVLGDLASWFFDFPSRSLLMLGVTGTNGKTTTTYLLDGALRRAGRACGLIGTVETRVLDEHRPSVRTTPEAPDLQALLALMVGRGADTCSMEVSSHALALGRVDGVEFDVVGFTNLSQDHLDFHLSMENYFAAKSGLFTPRRARRAVICVDDEWGRRLAASAAIPVLTLSTLAPDGEPAAADWTVTDRHRAGGGTQFSLRGPAGAAIAARCPLPGDFNVANTALALVMLICAGFSGADAAGWLAASAPVPGRMERVSGTGAQGEPLAVVDYAHTPDAVAAALRTLRAARPGPLVVVLGAGGDRDRAKRQRMGAAAAADADLVVITDDNPRSEDPAAIRAEVLAGAAGRAAGTVTEIGDRRAAILEGVRLAWGTGTVLVAGKGHERGQEIAGTVYPFDDREVLAEALREAARRGQA